MSCDVTVIEHVVTRGSTVQHGDTNRTASRNMENAAEIDSDVDM